MRLRDLLADCVGVAALFATFYALTLIAYGVGY